MRKAGGNVTRILSLPSIYQSFSVAGSQAECGNEVVLGLSESRFPLSRRSTIISIFPEPRGPSAMPIQWEPFVELVRRHRRLLLTTHVRPDGDGIGSMRALGEILEQQDKQVRMVVASVFPPRYEFL